MQSSLEEWKKLKKQKKQWWKGSDEISRKTVERTVDWNERNKRKEGNEEDSSGENGDEKTI